MTGLCNARTLFLKESAFNLDFLFREKTPFEQKSASRSLELQKLWRKVKNDSRKCFHFIQKVAQEAAIEIKRLQDLVGFSNS